MTRVTHEFDSAGRMRLGGGGYEATPANLLTALEAGAVYVETNDSFERRRVSDLIKATQEGNCDE